MMRIGVFSDVHGNLAALQAVLADGARQGVEQWVCLGDVAFKGPQPQECIDTIAAAPQVVQIVGNTDQWLFQGFPSTFNPPAERRQQMERFREWGLERLQTTALERLRTLPFSHTINIGSEQVLFVHSSPRSTEDWLPASLSEAELMVLAEGHMAGVVVYGHIHNPFVRKVGNRVVINTGSTGNPTDGDNRAAYLLLESSTSGSASNSASSYMLRRIPYDIEATVAAAIGAGMPMAEQYAQALRTGSAL